MTSATENVPAGFHWHDPQRSLTFHWTGGESDTVLISAPNRDQPIGYYDLADSVRHAINLGALPLPDQLELFQLACASWRPPNSAVGYDVDQERRDYEFLRAAVRKAANAGDGVSMDHLNATYEAAIELIRVRG